MPTMDVRYINPFLSAVGLVFRTMAEMSVAMGKPYIKSPEHELAYVYTVAATIELTVTTDGIVSMRFCRPVVMALVKALTGEMPKEMDAACMDALGEVANMVVGNAKKDFPLGGTSISTPKVVMADPLDEPPILVMPFDCSAGRFLLEARLRSKPEAAIADESSADSTELPTPESPAPSSAASAAAAAGPSSAAPKPPAPARSTQAADSAKKKPVSETASAA